MSAPIIPFARYPDLPPLFVDFLAGLPEFFPDPPTIDAAAARGRELLARRAGARVPRSALRARGAAGEAMAGELARGAAVAVMTGHQVGLFTGPLFTLVKAFDACRVARELSGRGVPAVPVFWALTDDHDLEEIARTARPGPGGPEILVLEGADRANRRPVGPLPIPGRISSIVEAFRPDARGEEAEEILARFAARSAPGVPYGEAFMETLLDLVSPEPLLVVDPLREELRAPTVECFLKSVEKAEEIRAALVSTEQRLKRQNRSIAVAIREGVFPFFAVENGQRRRVEDPREAAERARDGKLWPSADVLTRPVLKSWLLPIAASVLGPSEIAYHAQSLPLFPLLGADRPILLPRSHLVLRGPAERRAAEALGLATQDLLSGASPSATAPPAPALEVERIAGRIADELSALSPSLSELDPSLAGALETAQRKISYQLEQLGEKMRKAAERRDETASKRRARIETMLRPNGQAAERIYPPLVPMLAYGREALEAVRRAATGSREGGIVVELGEPAETEARRAG